MGGEDEFNGYLENKSPTTWSISYGLEAQKNVFEVPREKSRITF